MQPKTMDHRSIQVRRRCLGNPGGHVEGKKIVGCDTSLSAALLMMVMAVCLAAAAAQSPLGGQGQNINDVLRHLGPTDSGRPIQIAPMTKQGDPTPGTFSNVEGGIFDSIFDRIGIKAGKTDPSEVQNKDGFLEYIDGDNSLVLMPGGTRATFGYFIKFPAKESGFNLEPEYFALFSYDKIRAKGKDGEEKTIAATELFVFGPFFRTADGKIDLHGPPRLVFGLAVDKDGRLLDAVPTDLARVSNFPKFSGKPEHQNEAVKPGVETPKSGCLVCHGQTSDDPQSTLPFPWVSAQGGIGDSKKADRSSGKNGTAGGAGDTPSADQPNTPSASAAGTAASGSNIPATPNGSGIGAKTLKKIAIPAPRVATGTNTGTTTSGTKTPTGPETGVGSADSCLTGNWRSDSITSRMGLAFRGGSGIVLTIKTGGHATIDYNGMQPIQQVGFKGNVAITEIYSGTAAADISAHDGLLTVSNVQSSALSGNMTNRYGKTVGIHDTGLGWVFYGDGKVPGQPLSFTCDGTTLVIEHMLAPDNVLRVFTFKRQ